MKSTICLAPFNAGRLDYGFEMLTDTTLTSFLGTGVETYQIAIKFRTK